MAQIGASSVYMMNLFPVKKRRMGVVHELIKGVKKKTRGAVIRITDKGKNSYLRRPVQPLFPLVESAF